MFKYFLIPVGIFVFWIFPVVVEAYRKSTIKYPISKVECEHKELQYEYQGAVVMKIYCPLCGEVKFKRPTD